MVISDEVQVSPGGQRAAQAPVPAGSVDPRVERSRDLVLAATIELLGEVGYGGLAIEAVAARSGVAKSTIYRHWPNKDELMADAVERLAEEALTVPPPGPLTTRVTAMLRAMAIKFLDPAWTPSMCLPAIIDSGERSEELAREVARQSEERSRPLVQVLDEGVDGGELPQGTDTEALADALVGPILLRRLFHRTPLEPDRVAGFVEQVLASR